jgi:hypothetical protein
MTYCPIEAFFQKLKREDELIESFNQKPKISKTKTEKVEYFMHGIWHITATFIGLKDHEQWIMLFSDYSNLNNIANVTADRLVKFPMWNMSKNTKNKYVILYNQHWSCDKNNDYNNIYHDNHNSTVNYDVVKEIYENENLPVELRLNISEGYDSFDSAYDVMATRVIK